MPDFGYRSTAPITTPGLRRTAYERVISILQHLEPYNLNLVELHFDEVDFYVYITVRGAARIPVSHVAHLGIEQFP